MLNLIRRVASRPASSLSHAEARSERHGPLVRMLQCDMANLDRLTRALAAPRG